MTRRRADRTPDTRLDWRDPHHMPVLRMMAFGPFDQGELSPVDPEEEQEHCAGMVSNRNPLAPHWTQDPTYHLTNRRK